MMENSQACYYHSETKKVKQNNERLLTNLWLWGTKSIPQTGKT